LEPPRRLERRDARNEGFNRIERKLRAVVIGQIGDVGLLISSASTSN
jgi:hypothetical protein